MKKLYLSSEDRKLGGVLGGLGEHLQVDPTILRIAFLAMMFVTGVVPLVVAYFAAWLIVPEDPRPAFARTPGLTPDDLRP